MLRKALLALGFVCLVMAWQPAAAEEKLPPVAEWIPANALLAVEVSKPKELLDAAFDPKLSGAVMGLPEYKKLLANQGYQQFLVAVAYLEVRLGTDWKTGLHKLVDGGATWAVTPAGASLLIIDATDEGLLRQLHEVVLQHAKDDAAKQGRPGRVASADYQGVTGWTLGDNEAHMILGRRLVLANRAEVLKEVLDLRAKPASGNLASTAGYQAARRSAGADAAAWAYVHLAALKKLPGIQHALAEQQNNPMGTLLLGGVAQSLRDADWIALSLRAQGETLALRAAVPPGAAASPDAQAAAFARPGQAGDGAWPGLTVPRQLAGLSFYRDLHAFYAAKEKLFGERSAGLIFFENMMGIFFSGRDLSNEVLAQTKPQIRFVAAGQKYDPEIGTPQVQIPAFAAVFRLKDPKKYGDVVEEAWQKAVGLVSVTRGQQAAVGLIIDRPTYRDTRYSIAYFPAGANDDKARLGMHYNFRPALVKLGEYLVISSTEQLAQDLIDAIGKEIAQPPKPLPGVHSAVEIDAAQIASLLDVNRPNLVRQNMVEKGNTQEQAETEVGVFTTLVKRLGWAKLSVGDTGTGQQAELELKLNLK